MRRKDHNRLHLKSSFQTTTYLTHQKLSLRQPGCLLRMRSDQVFRWLKSWRKLERKWEIRPLQWTATDLK